MDRVFVAQLLGPAAPFHIPYQAACRQLRMQLPDVQGRAGDRHAGLAQAPRVTIEQRRHARRSAALVLHQRGHDRRCALARRSRDLVFGGWGDVLSQDHVVRGCHGCLNGVAPADQQAPASGGQSLQAPFLRLVRTFGRWCRRYSPVKLPRVAATSSGVPAATTRPALVAALGAEIDDPVGGLDDFQIVLDDDHRVALIDQRVQHVQELASRRRSAGRWSARRGCRACWPVSAGAKFLGQLHPLRLAARQRGRRLADMDVAEADPFEGLESCRGSRHRLEELERPSSDRHIEHVGDRLLPR